MSAAASDTDEEIVRPAILVHTAANGQPMRFSSAEDGDIVFDEARIKRVIKNQNLKLKGLRDQYGGEDKTPQGAYPPVLDSHDNESNDCVVGRLPNDLYFEKRDVPGVGKSVSCAMTKIKFLGRDAVKRVKDGRIFHLSIGINEKTDTLGEVSTVVVPAAPGAAVLTHMKQGEKKMSDLSKLREARKTRNEILTRLSAEVTAGKTKLVGIQDTVKLAGRRGEVTKRLSGLMQSRKLTPAEFKKLDLVKLSKLDDAALTVVMESYEGREPLVEAGQRGSADAIDAATVTRNLEETQLTRLRSETVKDFVKMSGGKEVKFKADGVMNDALTRLSAGGVPPEKKDMAGDAVPGQGGEEKNTLGHHMAACKQMVAHLEAGNLEKSKELCHMMMKNLNDGGATRMSGDVKSEDAQVEMTGVQAQVDELNTQMARLAGMVQELMGAEKAEGDAMDEMAGGVPAAGGAAGDGKPAPDGESGPGNGDKPGEAKPKEEPSKETVKEEINKAK